VITEASRYRAVSDHSISPIVVVSRFTHIRDFTHPPFNHIGDPTMKSLARLSVRRRWFVLIAWIALFIGINIASFSVGSSYSNSFSLPGTNSTHALHLLQEGFKSKAGDSDDIVFAVTKGTIESHASTIDAMLAKVAKLKSVASVVSPFCTATSASCPGRCS